MVNKLYEKIFCLEHDEMEQLSFSLYLECIEGDNPDDNMFWLKSDIIPIEMLSHFEELISPRLVFKTKDSDADRDYMDELLSFVSDQVISDKRYHSFFYPQFFIDTENNVRPEIVRRFDKARTEIRHCYWELIDLSQPLHLYYFSQLIRVPKRFLGENRFSVHRITRKKFEECINSEFKAEGYVEIYFSAVRFKLIRSKDKQPLYYIALNKRNEPVLAIKAEEQD